MTDRKAAEYRVEKIPNGTYPKKREKALNKLAAEGWRLVEVKAGPIFRSWDTATFERA